MICKKKKKRKIKRKRQRESERGRKLEVIVLDSGGKNFGNLKRNWNPSWANNFVRFFFGCNELANQAGAMLLALATVLTLWFFGQFNCNCR